MRTALAAALTALCAAHPATAGQWTERYFGVGSDGDRGSACSQARDHAQGNSFRACMERRGTREGTSYTDCQCTQSDGTLHVCNVNLKVVCVGSLASSGATGSQALKGGPKGRADRRRDAHSGARSVVSDRPGPAAPPAKVAVSSR